MIPETLTIPLLIRSPLTLSAPPEFTVMLAPLSMVMDFTDSTWPELITGYDGRPAGITRSTVDDKTVPGQR